MARPRGTFGTLAILGISIPLMYRRTYSTAACNYAVRDFHSNSCRIDFLVSQALCGVKKRGPNIIRRNEGIVFYDIFKCGAVGDFLHDDLYRKEASTINIYIYRSNKPPSSHF